ncbi:MAG: hypothetical protein JNK02_03545 [Planctomycetes bacterium]|nr:hypothetical protein [Planctomycetota bacterium]
MVRLPLRAAALVALLALAGLVSSQDAPAPAAPEQPAAPLFDETTRLRAVARMMVNVEGRHRTQVAEIELITLVAEKERLDDVLRSAIRTRHLAEEDHAARMAVFQRDLGPELFARLRAALDAGPGQAPPLRAILPEPPPPPPPLPHEEEERNAAKRARAEEEGEEG